MNPEEVERIAGRIPIVVGTILRDLSRSRPIFHSEADFQHALAWKFHQEFPDARVRLEMPLRDGERSSYCDIWLSLGTRMIAMEFKYKTRALNCSVADERFLLKDQSAQDIGRSDFLKDVLRLENIRQVYPGVECHAILLTNDSAYWGKTRKEAPVDRAFRLEDGRLVAGCLAWDARASAGTRRDREAELKLKGAYRVEWNDYSRCGTSRYGLFRYLALDVTSSTAGGPHSGP